MSKYVVHQDGDYDGVINDCIEEGMKVYVHSVIGWIEITEDFTSTVNGNTYRIEEEV